MYPHSKTYGMQPFDILRRDSKLSEVQFLNCQNDSKSTRHANRLINFYEYDARRDLQKRGKILKHLCWPTIFIFLKTRHTSQYMLYAMFSHHLLTLILPIQRVGGLAVKLFRKKASRAAARSLSLLQLNLEAHFSERDSSTSASNRPVPNHKFRAL